MDLPTYHNPSFIDLNEDQPQHDDHHLFNNPNPQVSSSLTLSYSPLEDQGEFFCRKQPRFPLQVSLEADRKIVSSGGSCEHHPKADHEESESDNNDLKLTIWKNDIIQDTNNNDHEKHTSTKYIDDSVKWTSSKMRMMRKMIITNTDHHRHRHHLPTNFNHKLDNHQITKNFGADHSSSSSSNIINTNTNINNGIIRVCSDCNTTKTPLWRSGPRGPKSLCNACGIRQRKARRAMAAAAAAAASADGTNINAAVDAAAVKSATTAKIQHKMKKPKISGDQQFKKRSCKLARGRKRLLCFEDLRISMSKSSAIQRGFPQDERDAAILLMALSYGLVHG